MKKLSGSTFYFKKLFPTAWFGFLVFFVVTGFISGAVEESIVFLIGPLFMAVFGFVLFKIMVWDLADEVFDHGDFLEFRKGNKIQKVSLKEIINIDYTQLSSPERVVIHTRNEGAIGKKLVFSLPIRLFPFSPSPLVSELIERVDHARNT